LETPTGPSWFTSSNRINGWSYDGNLTQLGVMVRSFTYDAEDRSSFPDRWLRPSEALLERILHSEL
jgi:hypothetical protein